MTALADNAMRFDLTPPQPKHFLLKKYQEMLLEGFWLLLLRVLRLEQTSLLSDSSHRFLTS